MPEISPTMYPFIIAGGGAIVLLLLLILIVRRRRANRAAQQDEADTGFAGADEEPAGVKLVGHEESPPSGDGSPDEGRQVEGPSEAQPVEAPQAARSEHLVAWGPDEAGSHRVVAAAGPDPRDGTASDNGHTVAPAITVTAPSGWSVVTSIAPGDPPSSIGIKIFKIDRGQAPEDTSQGEESPTNGEPETQSSRGALEAESQPGARAAGWETSPQVEASEPAAQPGGRDTDTQTAAAIATPEAESPSGVEGEPGAELGAGVEGESGPGIGTGATSASEVPPGQTGEGPEGQPFERDGRWWFRRDGELLVYDDDNSEWKAAPESGSPAPDGSPGETGGSRSQGETQPGAATTTTMEREEPVEGEAALRPRPEGATSWKCPTCGATNGSAAEGCRLCFTPRA